MFITRGLQRLMGCILPTMHCGSQHCWELLHPFVHHCQHARNNSQHCWRNIVGSCCIRLYTTANTEQQLRTLLSQQCWELLRPFARSLKMTDTVIAFLLLLLLVLWRACNIDLVPGDMEFFSTCKYKQQDQTKRIWCLFGQQQKITRYVYYFGGARSKEFARLRNVPKLTFLGQDKAR